jgi:hypothetical protein
MSASTVPAWSRSLLFFAMGVGLVVGNLVVTSTLVARRFSLWQPER